MSANNVGIKKIALLTTICFFSGGLLFGIEKAEEEGLSLSKEETARWLKDEKKLRMRRLRRMRRLKGQPKEAEEEGPSLSREETARWLKDAKKKRMRRLRLGQPEEARSE